MSPVEDQAVEPDSRGNARSAESRTRPRRVAATATSPVSKARRATIQEVAQEAKVSVSTVSNVIRDAPGVRPEMKARVSAAIEKLGYRPQAAARAMRGRSFTIGVMLTGLSSPFQMELAEGIADELDPSLYQEVFVGGGTDPERQRKSIEGLTDRQVDGLIVIAPSVAVSWLEELGSIVPTLVIARHGGSAHYDTVVGDDQGGARLMVDHLVGLGHRRILHTSQSAGRLKRPFVLSQTARCDGYVNAMKRHGLEPDVIETAYSEDGGHRAAVEAFARPMPPTAIFAGADIAALGALRAAEEHGLRVPQDITITGYDNIYASTIGRVSLTTVDQAGHLAGQASARLLLERLNGRTQPVHYVVSPRLLPRGTSAAPARKSPRRSA